MVEKSLYYSGEINGLVNCAGVTFGNDLFEYTNNDWNKTYEVNLKEPSLAIYASSNTALTDNDDLTVDMFEGAERGVGKWARIHFEQNSGMWSNTASAASTNAVGAIVILPVADGAAISDHITNLATTNGFTILDSAGISKMYIFIS